ncbi:sugar porter family MFS transporter [Fibrobacter sp. UWP2]|jgi:SP family sugar:H+ symporter-like MFS transporter|uniref:sugar porter family MFS transporter n=1 Tax=Fibrobacter sp. UWP2 TaxID=1896216 RepID=UPI00090F0028|nr:sugar porter family MFS transporter [Fibrobacter sp. UWP2]SHI73679.1 MFS transporter, sugar porter (SP) family [Fibrobacter sp. UWP2]
MSKDNPHMGHIVLITLSAAIGGFLFGFDSSVINGANGALKAHFNATDYQLAWAVSLALISAAIGAFFAGRIADAFGRVRCMLFASDLFLISAIGSGIPFGMSDFILWRVIGGFGIGMASIIAPIYIAETAPAHLRGRLGSMQQFAIVIGIFVALLSNYVIVRIAGSANNAIIGNIKAWQVMFWVEIIPAVLYGYAAWKLPESPRYLIHKGFIDQARDVLAKINPEGVEKEVEIIQASFKNKKQPKFTDLLEIINGRERISPILWAGLGLAILQQLVGINVIFYYGTMLWQSVGFGESDAFLTSVISSAVNLVMTVVAILLIDKIGRKPLLLIGSIGMAITLSTLTVCFMSAGADGSLPGTAAVIALIAANLYITFFAATWGPVMWVMLGEMFNNRIRTIAIAICGLAQWFANFVVTWTFPVLTGKDGIGVGPTYAIYSFFAIFSIFFVAKFIKETKGKELEDM